MSQPTKPIHQRQGFHSLLVTTSLVVYAWYGQRRIFLYEVHEGGHVALEPFDHFTFGEDAETVGVLLALEAINRRLEDDEAVGVE